MPDTTAEIYFANPQAQAVFAADGPKPRFLLDAPGFNVLVVGVEAGQQIPLHSGEAALYYFLEGSGLMMVGEESYAINPGVAVIAPAGSPRGMNARTRVIFLASKGG